MDPIELAKAAVYGVVEGVTEWLPISSTGHMLLLNQFLTMDVSEDFWNMFLVVIQLVVFHFNSLLLEFEQQRPLIIHREKVAIGDAL